MALASNGRLLKHLDDAASALVVEATATPRRPKQARRQVPPPAPPRNRKYPVGLAIAVGLGMALCIPLTAIAFTPAYLPLPFVHVRGGLVAGILCLLYVDTFLIVGAVGCYLRLERVLRAPAAALLAVELAPPPSPAPGNGHAVGNGHEVIDLRELTPLGQAEVRSITPQPVPNRAQPVDLRDVARRRHPRHLEATAALRHPQKFRDRVHR
jgi:hypothetical protein